MHTLILGLGNPLLGDDGVGWHIAREVARFVDPREVEVDYHAGGGLSLMERLAGYERAFLLDAMATGEAPAGCVYCCPLEALDDPGGGHFSSSHDMTLQTALELGRQLGETLPASITVVAVEAGHVYEFTEELSPALAAAVPQAAETVRQALLAPCSVR